MSQETGHRPAGTEDLLGSPRPDEYQQHDEAEPASEQRVHEGELVDEDRPYDGNRFDEGAVPDQDRMPHDDRPADDAVLEGDRVTDDRTLDDELRTDDQLRADDELRTDDQLRDGEQLPAATTPDLVDQAPPVEQAPPATEADHELGIQLFTPGDVEGLRGRWLELQAAFVDEPRSAVQRADQLVAEVLQTLAATFARNKQELEGQWQREGAVDTEDLRQALRRYRSFFDQLLRT